MKGHDKGNNPDRNPLRPAGIHAFLSIMSAIFRVMPCLSLCSKSDPDGAAGYENTAPLSPKNSFGQNLHKVSVALLYQAK